MAKVKCYRVQPGYCLHWPEYAPSKELEAVVNELRRKDGSPSMLHHPMTGRGDRVWALEGEVVRIEHPAMDQLLEGQRHKLANHKLQKGDVVANRPVPSMVARLIQAWDAKQAGEPVPPPPTKVATLADEAAAEKEAGEVAPVADPASED